MLMAYCSQQIELVSEHKAHKAHHVLYTAHRKIRSPKPFLSSIFTFLPAAASVTTLMWPRFVLAILVRLTLHFHEYSATFGLNVGCVKLG